MKIDLKEEGRRFMITDKIVPICSQCVFWKYERGSWCTKGNEEEILNPVSGDIYRNDIKKCRDCREDISYNGCGPFGLQWKSK